jgi:hypothetical protein
MLATEQSSGFSQRVYGDILRDLEDFRSHLVKSGLLRAGNSRLRRLIVDLNQLEEARVRGHLQQLEELPSEKIKGLVWSLVEAQEFAEIFRGLDGHDPQIMKLLMRKVLKGTLHPSDETQSSNLGRNTAFELLLGSRLRFAGSNPKLGQQTDLVVDYLDSRLHIECKRPQTKEAVEENIAVALSQLGKRFASDSRPDSSAGLVAISVSKAVNPDSKWLIVEREGDIEPNLSREAEYLHQQCARDYRRKADPRVVGILYHILAPIRVKKPQGPSLIAASQIDCCLDDAAMHRVFPISGDELRKLLRRLRLPPTHPLPT